MPANKRENSIEISIYGFLLNQFMNKWDFFKYLRVKGVVVKKSFGFDSWKMRLWQ